MDGDWEAQSSYVDPIAVFLLGFHPAWKWTGWCASAALAGLDTESVLRHHMAGTLPTGHFKKLHIHHFHVSYTIEIIFVLIYINMQEISHRKKTCLKHICSSAALIKMGDFGITFYYSFRGEHDDLMWSYGPARYSKAPLGGTIGLPLTFLETTCPTLVNSVAYSPYNIFNSNPENNHLYDCYASIWYLNKDTLNLWLS